MHSGDQPLRHRSGHCFNRRKSGYGGGVVCRHLGRSKHERSLKALYQVQESIPYTRLAHKRTHGYQQYVHHGGAKGVGGQAYEEVICEKYRRSCEKVLEGKIDSLLVEDTKRSLDNRVQWMGMSKTKMARYTVIVGAYSCRRWIYALRIVAKEILRLLGCPHARCLGTMMALESMDDAETDYQENHFGEGLLTISQACRWIYALRVVRK